MAVTHLLDTSVYSQPIRKNPLKSVESRWRALGDSAVCISIICEAEVLQGLEMSQSQSLVKAYSETLKGKLTILPYDLASAKAYSKLVAKLSKTGKSKSPFDLLIASTAIAHSLILATCNYRDFKDMEGLAVEDWSR